MNDSKLAFIDTNILVYIYDTRVPKKQKIATELLENMIATESGIISTQVAQEFCNVAINKIGQLDTEQLKHTLTTVLMPLVRQSPSEEFYLRAITLQAKHGQSFYDSLIIQAAIDLGCDILYSEDLQSNQTFGSLKIINPFS